MYFHWILKSWNPRNSNSLQKNRENNYFSSRTKLEVIQYAFYILTMSRFSSVALTICKGIQIKNKNILGDLTEICGV